LSTFSAQIGVIMTPQLEGDSVTFTPAIKKLDFLVKKTECSGADTEIF